MVLDENRVWKFIPAEVLRPELVQVDGKGGVTSERFEELKNDAIRQAGAHILARYQLTLPTGQAFTSLTADQQSSLQDAVANIAAAYVLRRLQAYQALAKDAFASGYASLDEWSLAIMREKNLIAGPAFVSDEFEAGFPKL